MNILKSKEFWLVVTFILFTIVLGFCQKSKKVAKPNSIPEWSKCNFTREGSTFECELTTTHTTKNNVEVDDRTDSHLKALKKGLIWISIDSNGKGKIIYDCVTYIVIKTVPLQQERGSLHGFVYTISNGKEIVNRGFIWEIPVSKNKIHSLAVTAKCKDPSYYETVARYRLYLASKQLKNEIN